MRRNATWTCCLHHSILSRNCILFGSNGDIVEIHVTAIKLTTKGFLIIMDVYLF